jgi:hypothetical protein
MKFEDWQYIWGQGGCGGAMMLGEVAKILDWFFFHCSFFGYTTTTVPWQLQRHVSRIIN